ncbi:MAG: HPr(Ser) kinase/phosphatase [Spirochaetales bacterium]|jgi:HPr kinase/phosphorylase|nr:HPr(Ser) kinase/phosphatase [Spirochaetales bacterium]
MKTFTVLNLLETETGEHNTLKLTCFAGKDGLGREIGKQNIYRPGLALSGFFDGFADKAIQVFGRGETAYLQKLQGENSAASLKKFFGFSIPCCAFSYNHRPNETFIALARESGCPLLSTAASTEELILTLYRILGKVFSENITCHGTMVEVFGIGVLIRGKSGIGKSEAALELIQRGHRLVADDAVRITCLYNSALEGTGLNEEAAYHMEIRGLGIINIFELYGAGAVRNGKEIQMIVDLEEWDPEQICDRIGDTEIYEELLGVRVPRIRLQVKPGRNIPIIVEAAAMNQRLKKMGRFSARSFIQNQLHQREARV